MTDEDLNKQFEKTWQHIEQLHRHFDVVTEDLKKDVQLVAEGVSNLDEKFTREFVLVREEMREGFGETRELDRRVSALERRKR
jgi:hypothetical protein